MVFAYAFLPVKEFATESLAALEQADSIIVPDFLLAELTSVVWQWIRHRDLPPELAYQVLEDSQHLAQLFVPAQTLWRRALALAVEVGHSPYDTLFLALAEGIETQLVTYDAKLLSAFPQVAVTPAQILA
jgi:predicted nucleic acid-binding protein